MYWWLGVKGIVPAMILTAAAMLAISWWFVRGIRVEPVKLTPKETFRGGLSIAKLGFFIVVTTFASTATMYIVRSFVSQKIGTDGVGMFQAAWNISNVYTGLITSAMMADFFPRLSERSNDHAAMARLTNEQGEIALIIGAPMIAGILLFIPVVLNILYSSQFMAATAILQWQMAGAFTGFLSWPLSVIFLAKREGTLLYPYRRSMVRGIPLHRFCRMAPVRARNSRHRGHLQQLCQARAGLCPCPDAVPVPLVPAQSQADRPVRRTDHRSAAYGASRLGMGQCTQ